jgi:four helix bundle protein
MPVRNFRDLIVWQKAMGFAVEICRETRCFPKEEIYGLRAQLRNSSTSIPANIAEGQGRKTTRECRRFLSVAYGSLCESQTHIVMAERLNYWSNEIAGRLTMRAGEVARLINGLQESLERKSKPKT